MNQNETYLCKCLWRKAGLGAEVADAHRNCPIHGIGGPMPMFAQFDLPGRNPVRRQAEMIHGGTDREKMDRLTDSEVTRVGTALSIGAEQARQKRDEALFGNAAGAGKDDRHVFSSGAMSSGKKPPYTAITRECLERFALQRGYGDDKYGVDNWMRGARDKQFILDRINHGIEHLLILANQVKADDPGSIQPGTDDAAAVCCAAMFVMRWQSEQLKHQMHIAMLKSREERQDTDGFRNGPAQPLRCGNFKGLTTDGKGCQQPAGHSGDCTPYHAAVPTDESSYGHGV